MRTNFTTLASPLRPTTRGGQPSASTFKAHLVFVVDTEIYACPINNIDRVLLRADAVMQPRSPAAPAWEVGRLATPHGVVPIISLRSLWGRPERPQTERDALLVVRLPDQNFVLLVDACLTVISSLPPETVSFRLPPQLRGSRGSAFETVIYWQESLLVTLQLNRLMSSEFENLLDPGAAESPHL
jgi:chemotaxis signal transduction protein